MSAACRFRIMDNNFSELITSSISYSSELSSFPGNNVINKFRSKVWKPQGHFEITSSNRNLYFNDGSDKTATLTVGHYTAPSTLATHIQAQLNLISSGWSVSYSTTTYKFGIANSSNVTLKLTSTTNAVWDTIGFTTGLDLGPTTSFVADEQRNHTDEYATFDMGYNAEMEFFALIGPLDQDFSISDDATIKIQANNLSLWTSPPLDVTLTRTDDGIFKFFDGLETGYRYWRFHIIDRLNPLGPEGLEFGHIYIGDYTSFSRNIANGFDMDQSDPTKSTESESGALYFDIKTKYWNFGSMNVGLITKADRNSMKALFNKLGTYTLFYIVIDPLEAISDSQALTKYVVFQDEPKFQHVINDIFNWSMNVREIL